ncbi:hypothetical protein MYX75_02370 [Acidobacteria bacterium AH-259-A15]|nr:hypothetical protein [Acidobacteria bacterium AH-259-A15]
MDSQEILTTVLGAIGGSGVIIIGLSAWLSKLWAARIVQAEKTAYAKEIEMLKSSLAASRVREQRNSEAQFQLYSQVWSCLQDVKSIGDRLWKRVTRPDLEEFVANLANARMAANRGRLILEEDHYHRLLEIFEAFENYQIGKRRLIDLRSKEEFDEIDEDLTDYMIRDQIILNKGDKQRYDGLLDEILTEFRQQLGLTT